MNQHGQNRAIARSASLDSDARQITEDAAAMTRGKSSSTNSKLACFIETGLVIGQGRAQSGLGLAANVQKGAKAKARAKKQLLKKSQLLLRRSLYTPPAEKCDFQREKSTDSKANPKAIELGE
jgi:hypothetical protein